MDTEYSKYEPLFGSWKIEKLIGEGNYGKVYEIRREDFGVTYRAALKAITIPKHQSDVKSVMSEGMDMESASTYFRSFVEEFTNEFALMDRLKGNSYIVNYEDHIVMEHEGEIGWDILIKMELLTSLNDYLNQHKVDENLVIKLGIDICRALEICENYNIIHRDIKPENIFVTDMGNFKLGDFGIARVAEKTTGASTKVGTNSYMAPEIVRGDRYNAKVDTYSLGIMLYKLLNNNRLPFLPAPPAPITYSIREEANARRLKGEILPNPAMAGAKLSGVILKATAFRPEDRYASPLEMRRALEECIGIKPVVEEKLPEKNLIQTKPDLEDEKTLAVPGLGKNEALDPNEETKVNIEDPVILGENVTDLEEKGKSKKPLKVMFAFACVFILVGIAAIVYGISGNKKPDSLFDSDATYTFTKMDDHSVVEYSGADLMKMESSWVSLLGNTEVIYKGDFAIGAMANTDGEYVNCDQLYFCASDETIEVQANTGYTNVFSVRGKAKGAYTLLVTDGKTVGRMPLRIINGEDFPDSSMASAFATMNSMGLTSAPRVEYTNGQTAFIELDLVSFLEGAGQTKLAEDIKKNGSYWTYQYTTIPCDFQVTITNDNKMMVEFPARDYGYFGTGNVVIVLTNGDASELYGCLRIPVRIMQ